VKRVEPPKPPAPVLEKRPEKPKPVPWRSRFASR